MNTALVIGALVVSFFLLLGLLSIIKTTFKTALIVALIVFGLQVFTGIGPGEVFQQVLQLLGGIGKWFQQWGGTYKPPSGFRENKQSIIWFISLI